MATRRVIADSDEEEDDDFDSPLKPGPTLAAPAATTAAAAHRYDADGEAEAPEMEPLSPVHQIGDALLHNHEYDQQQRQQQRTSGSTDTTFFDNIHDEHRRMAQAQNHHQQQQQRSSLIENIVRMSQKASTSSSGDTVSLPPKAGGAQTAKLSNVSSATDVTSPTVKLANKAKHKGAAAITLSGKQVSSASEVTTPRKSDGRDEWDVPSSGDEGCANKSASKAGGSGSATKTYGKRKRGSISKASASVPDFYAGPEELEVAEVAQSSSDRLPAAKKGKVVEIASDESIIPDTGKFYIAPSSLTASQKEQYRRVHISSSDENNSGRGGEEDVAAPDYSMAPPPASKPKSSCATTIAYSTPSRYASSGPRPPWELAQPALDDDGEVIGTEDDQGGPEITENIVDLTSSPDIITSAHSKRREQPISTGKMPKLPRQLSRVDEEGVQPIGYSPSPKRRQKPSRRLEDDDDELAGDDGWDSEDVGFHREVYKPRPSRRRTNGGGGANAGNDARAAKDTANDDVMQDLPPTQDPHQQQRSETEELGRSEEVQEIQDITKAPAAMVDDNAKPPPKKRGRKKKQPPPPPEETSDELAQAQTPSVSLGTGSGAADSEPTAESAAAKPDADGDYAPVEQPSKKKRGRPRKSEGPELSSIRTARNTLPSTADPLAMEEEDFTPDAAVANKPSTRDSSSLSDVPPSDEDEDDDEDEEIVPVKRGRKKAVKRPKLSEPSDEAGGAVKGSGSASPLKEVDRNTKLQSPAATAEAASEPESSTVSKKPPAVATSSTPAKTPNPATPSQQQPGKVAYRVGLSKKSRVTSLLKIIRK